MYQGQSYGAVFHPGSARRVTVSAATLVEMLIGYTKKKTDSIGQMKSTDECSKNGIINPKNMALGQI